MKQKFKNIKSLDEFFSHSLGDSFNSSNGVFKVNYRSYDDLSIPFIYEPDHSVLIKDSIYKKGDIVSGRVKGKKKRVKGRIVEVFKSPDEKSYIIKILSFKDKKIYTLIPGSIRFVEDTGNIANPHEFNISAKQRNLQKLKYNAGSIMWRSLE